VNENMKNVLNKGMELAGAVVSSVVKYAKDCQEQDRRIAAQRAADMRQAEIAIQKANLQPEHEGFGSAVGRCLGNDYDICGLKPPRRYEDICCDDSRNSIRINPGGFPDFAFEAKRDISKCGSLDDFRSGRSQVVPAASIEQTLNRTLRKYANRRGYDFSRVVVDDIPNDKVRITAQGVTLTPDEYRRRCGGYGY